MAIKQPTGGLLPGGGGLRSPAAPRLDPRPYRRRYSWAVPPNPGGQMAPAPRSEQRGRWRNEAGGGLSAPGPHGQRAGVQGGGRMARDARKRTALGGQAGKRFRFLRGKGRSEPPVKSKTLIPTPTSVTNGAPEAHLRLRRVVGELGELGSAPQTAGNTRIQQ